MRGLAWGLLAAVERWLEQVQERAADPMGWGR